VEAPRHVDLQDSGDPREEHGPGQWGAAAHELEAMAAAKVMLRGRKGQQVAWGPGGFVAAVACLHRGEE
jgi:hypothetical protein